MASLIDRVFGIEKRINQAAEAAVEKAATTTFGYSQAWFSGMPLPSANGPEQAYDNSWVAYACIKRLATDAAGIPLVVLSDPDDKDSVAITRAILGLARSFGLAVTAEGIENAQQLAFLQQEGCDEIQGYYFAKPMPLAEFIAFCRSNQAL